MIYTAGIDVGSTYTKAVILSEDDQVVGRGLLKTGFKLNEAGERALQQAEAAGYGKVCLLSEDGEHD